MNTTLLPASEQTLGTDYKDFIRQFENYRQMHPEYSFQQAMDVFTVLQQQKNPGVKRSQ